jgi:small ligand-binding sensory domain FIST
MSITPRTDAAITAALNRMNEVWSDKIPAEVILVACDLERENAKLLAANAELIDVRAELSATAGELRAENAELRREKARLREALDRIVALGARMPEDAEEVCIAKAAIDATMAASK